MMKRFDWLLLVLSIFCVFVVACSPNPEITSLPTETTTTIPSTKTPTPTQTSNPTSTPIPIVFKKLGSPFSSECSPALIVVDNGFNGIQNDFTANPFSGHVDFWTNTCSFYDSSGEVLAPVSGTIFQIRDDVFDLRVDTNTYISGILEALQFMGVQDPNLESISEFSIEFGHIALMDGIQVGQHVDKGMPMAEIVSCNCGLGPKLAYTIRFKYGTKTYQMSPTLLLHDEMVAPNFQLPDSPEYTLLFPDGKVPFQCDITKVPAIMGKDFWKPYFCYPEPNAQH